MSYVPVGDLLASLVCDRVAIDMILKEEGVSENVREHVREIITGRIDNVKENKIIDLPNKQRLEKLRYGLREAQMIFANIRTMSFSIAKREDIRTSAERGDEGIADILQQDSAYD
jgi:hypothetical protein